MLIILLLNQKIFLIPLNGIQITSNVKLKHQDETWALLKFDNIQIALVTPGQHPPHFAIIDEEVANLDGKKTHRDGIQLYL